MPAEKSRLSNELTRIVGLGAGGNAKVVIEILRLTDGYELVGLTDVSKELWGETVLGVPVLGDDRVLEELRRQGVGHAFIGVGSVADNTRRRLLFEKSIDLGFTVVNAVHPSACLSNLATWGPGLTAMPRSIVNSDAALGQNVLVNTGAIVEHDCILGDHVHVATGASLASTVRVGSMAHVGAGATIRQGIEIGEGAVVGIGAAVVKDVDPWTVVVGVPARFLKEIGEASSRKSEAGTEA